MMAPTLMRSLVPPRGGDWMGSHRGEIRLDFGLCFDLARTLAAFDTSTSDSSAKVITTSVDWHATTFHIASLRCGKITEFLSESFDCGSQSVSLNRASGTE
jgi:hypothetical protein